MIYDNIQNNLLYFIDTFQLLSFEQIAKMFSDVKESILRWHIKDLSLAHKIDMRSESNIIKSRKALTFSPSVQANLTKTAWIVANVGSTKIESIESIGLPVSCEFITTDGNVYDVCVIDKTKIDAIKTATANYWRRNLLDGQIDYTIHLAIVENKAIGELLKGSLFTSYCIISEDGTVSYYTWGLD